jgi:hypothetical protein
MAYASQSGRARTSSTNPEAFGVCDRCSQWVQHNSLRPQAIWAGSTLLNINILVCNRCWDRPNETTRSIILPADPTPTINPRVEPFLYDETEGPTQLIGQPVGLQQGGVTPLNNGVHYGVPLIPLSLTSIGGNTVTATFSTPHNLATNDQISVEGLTQPRATGFYSVVVSSAMAFTYQTFSNIAAGSLLTAHTRMITVKVGLPRGVVTIPQIGP